MATQARCFPSPALTNDNCAPTSAHLAKATSCQPEADFLNVEKTNSIDLEAKRTVIVSTLTMASPNFRAVSAGAIAKVTKVPPAVSPMHRVLQPSAVARFKIDVPTPTLRICSWASQAQSWTTDADGSESSRLSPSSTVTVVCSVVMASSCLPGCRAAGSILIKAPWQRNWGFSIGYVPVPKHHTAASLSNSSKRSLAGTHSLVKNPLHRIRAYEFLWPSKRDDHPRHLCTSLSSGTGDAPLGVPESAMS
mmetsp:Transcript_120557/g.276222  ORF Transcript_120557/g.276222 Transcript_120557/m.276222 type:complete len:250 (+) Transcript_120557:240-989(+)